uniref:Uncharacterized protein LOC111132471 n=1 Tax=Crassostrea virginica TaxID=6565 RepID=A0A8B8E763_CRAVI|nr:uncharacterized protein LOC111132471 [Crassostrea virginica]
MARQFFTRILPCVALTPAVSAFLGSSRDQFAPYTKKDKGESLEIVRLQKETGKDGVVYKLKLNEENLKSIMLHPEVKDKPVVIVSVAGEFRTGKSFLLNIFLKYLECGRKESDWLTGDIEGFEWRRGHKRVTRGVHLWRRGHKRVTRGVHLWSEPFVMSGALGDRVAVLLMDTPGLFDNDMTATDSAKVFVFSSLISSVQILNIKEHLQANDMQALETFTQYSSLVEHISEHSDSKQRTPLVFLIRDWADKEAYRYGKEGGTAYVKKTLSDMESSQKEIKKLHENINSRFPNFYGFLLPHPGIAVTQKEFSGNVKGNLIMSAEILFSGALPSKVLRMYKFCKIACISNSTFMNHQKYYLFPSISHVWSNFQHDYFNDVKLDGRAVVLGGDGRADTPGHSAKSGCYSVVDLDEGIVADIQLVQSNGVKSSSHMEKEGLVRCVDFFKSQDINIQTLVTDRHVQIVKWVRENMPESIHLFDVWHVAKGLKKKLFALSKEKDCSEIQQWIKSIINHLYWIASTSLGLEAEVVWARWTSLCNHIIDVHIEHSAVFNSCEHGPLEGRERHKMWLKSGHYKQQATEKRHSKNVISSTDISTGRISFSN